MTNLNDEIIKNQKLVHHTINKYFPDKVYDQDIHQIGMIGLWKALEDFDESKGYKFSTFAVRVIKNAINGELRKDKAEFRKCNQDAYRVYDDDDNEWSYEDNSEMIEERICCLDFSNFCKRLNEGDAKIIQLKEKGLSNEDIAKQLNIDKKTVGRAWKHIKERLIKECF